MIKLSERGKQIRRDVITLSKANGGYHWGGSFSCVEILTALYDHVMMNDDQACMDDQFILSKGHSCWPYYVILRERGLFPKLDGHPTCDPYNGVWCSTGSLGHGFPMALGMAWAKKMKGGPGRVFVVVGDGECQEGTTWESMQIAVRLRLDNLVVVVDKNNIQGSGRTEDILPMEGELCEVAEAIGWFTVGVPGHSEEKIKGVLDHIFCGGLLMGKPLMVIAHTVKGAGVSFMEDALAWHAKWLDDEHEKLAMEELR